MTSSYVALFLSRQVKSTTETLGVGTRKAIPVSFPLSSGRTFPTAYDTKQSKSHLVQLYGILLPCELNPSHTFAAPVELGMIFCEAPRPPRQSFIEGPSTVFCVAEHQKEHNHVTKLIQKHVSGTSQIEGEGETCSGMHSCH